MLRKTSILSSQPVNFPLWCEDDVRCCICAGGQPSIRTLTEFISTTVSLLELTTRKLVVPPLTMPRALFSHVRGFSALSLRDPIRANASKNLYRV